ncbi:hypothetical protein FJY68_03865 [candidate division WOR-3 bacterium]|uniref:Flp pilus assembly protein CpaB n=1 Tax=candidate division WOR-3 bacterium TaxID=2052148 RepID=A0A938BSW0_UNCW3|nr:hypothetical protein [candidate division WOR-3 bacterium]
MKTLFLTAAIVALVAAAAWALSSPRRAEGPYTVEISDVAGAGVPTVVPEVVVRANQMPEVVVRASSLPSVASLGEAGPESWY